MNTTDRKLFWDTLCSLDGKDIQADRERLLSTIKLPNYIYRYRPVNLRTIDALQQNRLYFSNSNYYDDPFDTLIQINFKTVNEAAKEFFNIPDLETKLADFAQRIGLNQDAVNNAIEIIRSNTPLELIRGIDNYLKHNIQSLLKSVLWSVCFSESGTNENMWLKYADQYRGFCVQYDLTDSKKMLCGTQSKCTDCVVNRNGSTLYPIYYSDEGYDATDYAKDLTVAYILRLHLPAIAEIFIQQLPAHIWDAERISLIKAKCHEYDAEWRMILDGQTPSPVMREWIPSGIILGLKTEERDKQLILRSARMAGIDHCYESYINDNYQIAIQEIQT